MFRDGGNNGDVDLRVSSVPERVETASPGSDNTAHGEKDETSKGNNEDEENECAEERLELLAGKLSADPLNSSNQLEETKDT